MMACIRLFFVIFMIIEINCTSINISVVEYHNQYAVHQHKKEIAVSFIIQISGKEIIKLKQNVITIKDNSIKRRITEASDRNQSLSVSIDQTHIIHVDYIHWEQPVVIYAHIFENGTLHYVKPKKHQILLKNIKAKSHKLPLHKQGEFLKVVVSGICDRDHYGIFCRRYCRSNEDNSTCIVRGGMCYPGWLDLENNCNTLDACFDNSSLENKGSINSHQVICYHSCNKWYAGDICPFSDDPCEYNECYVKDKCHHVYSLNDDKLTEYNCTCLWKDKLCQTHRDPCQALKCKNGGTCVHLNSTHSKCVCHSQFEGDECEISNSTCDIECVYGDCITTTDHSQSYCRCNPPANGIYCEFCPDENIYGNECQYSGIHGAIIDFAVITVVYLGLMFIGLYWYRNKLKRQKHILVESHNDDDAMEWQENSIV